MVPESFSSYVNFELEWGYRFNVEAGESIRVISESDVKQLNGTIPPDFWVFDSQRVAIFEYSPSGEWLGAKILDTGTEPYVKLATMLKEKSVDLNSYFGTKRRTGRFP